MSILGVLITQYKESLVIAKTILTDMQKMGWGEALFETKIREIQRLKILNILIKQFLNMIVLLMVLLIIKN